MAISTILNEHINEALVEVRPPPPASTPDLKESLISEANDPKESPQEGKKKVNFKQRLVKQRHDKSFSRDGKPNF